MIILYLSRSQIFHRFIDSSKVHTSGSFFSNDTSNLQRASWEAGQFPCGDTSLRPSATISNAPFRVSVYLHDVTASFWVKENQPRICQDTHHKCVMTIPNLQNKVNITTWKNNKLLTYIYFDSINKILINIFLKHEDTKKI